MLVGRLGRSEYKADPDSALELPIQPGRPNGCVGGSRVLQAVRRPGPDVEDVETEENRLQQTHLDSAAVVESDVFRIADAPVRNARRGPKLDHGAGRHIGTKPFAPGHEVGHAVHKNLVLGNRARLQNRRSRARVYVGIDSRPASPDSCLYSVVTLRVQRERYAVGWLSPSQFRVVVFGRCLVYRSDRLLAEPEIAYCGGNLPLAELLGRQSRDYRRAYHGTLHPHVTQISLLILRNSRLKAATTFDAAQACPVPNLVP